MSTNILPGYQPVVGMEIHVQLATQSKMFTAAPNNPDTKEPNQNIDDVVTAQPGTLPVVNAEAVRLGVLLGLALNCKIPKFSKFDRKHYFYPDLPKGYQISQYDQPIAEHGYVDIKVGGKSKRIRITRAHLEEDAGKNMHPAGMSYSLVDYNRAGAPLLEIVTEPDIESAEEARIFLQELRNIVRYVGASSADMEKGTMRCEPNISVRKPGETSLPKYKVEVKNINSFKFCEAAINYEVARHIKMLERGETPLQQTMGWDEKNGVTVPQRSKEEASDYRYFPEPDLPILHFTEAQISAWQQQVPELPEAKRQRLKTEYDLADSDVEVLIINQPVAEYFETVVSEIKAWRNSDTEFDVSTVINLAAKWLVQDFAALYNPAFLTPGETKITPENFAELMIMIATGAVSGSGAKQVLKALFENGGDPSEILIDLGLTQINDISAVDTVISEVINKHSAVVEQYKAGNEKVFGFLVGQVMVATKGTANPQLVNEVLKKKLME